METEETTLRDLPKIGAGKLVALGVLVVVILLAAFVAKFLPDRAHQKDLEKQAQEIADAPAVVDVVHPQQSALDFDITLPASAMPKQQTAIYARVDGYLKRWLVDINAHVQQGQLLAEIDAPDTDAQLNETVAALEQAQANVRKAEADLALANATYERYHGLLATGGVTQQELDTRLSNATDAAAAKHSADAAVNLAQATKERLEAAKGFEKITAPFAGTITFRNYDVGARISSTDTAVGHEMFDIAQTDQLRIYASVPQSYVTFIQEGQPAYFTVRNYPDRKFTGSVARSAGIIDPATRTLLTELDFDNKDNLLWSGMYGQIQIHVHQDHPALTVPTAAMMFESDGTQVAVVDADSKVHFQKISVGQDLGQRIEVLSGLSAGDQVVSNPGEKLTEGLIVQVAGTSGPSDTGGKAAVAEVDFASAPAHSGGGAAK
jgi:RND family efflux transporter MFP subunit